ncbi:MAG: sugar ABC transporter permease, partial [Clostridiales bacterium]|nr:sugar ABC transporter permease [Clostridiales bacterium]
MTAGTRSAGRTLWRQSFWRHMLRDRYLVLMALPAVAYFLVFHYFPMYGVIIAFRDFSPGKGIWGSPWAGFRHFQQFFGGFYFGRLLGNTLAISVWSLLWGFPLPIAFALMLNEFREGAAKRAVQTVSYLPHFISLVVTCGMIINFLSPANGIVNVLIKALGGKP